MNDDKPQQRDVYDVIRGCSDKKRYDTERSARATAAKVYEQRGVYLRVYPCTEGCGGYHLTHRDATPPPQIANQRPPRRSMREITRDRNRERNRRRYNRRSR